MSTLKVAAINNPSASSGGLAISTGGNVTGAGLDLVVAQSFSAVSSVSVNGCWTSGYTDYLVNISYASGVINDYLGFRLRASAADNTTSNYSYGIAEQNFDTSTLTARTNEASSSRARVGFTGSVGNRAAVTMQIASPQAAAQTIWNLQVTSGTKGMFGGGIFTATTQFDGFTIYSEGASTITGTIRVYGYRNS